MEKFVQLYSGSAVNSIGIQRLMDLIVDYFPTYSERGMYTATTPNGVKVELLTSETEVLTAQVFKTINGPICWKNQLCKSIEWCTCS